MESTLEKEIEVPDFNFRVPKSKNHILERKNQSLKIKIVYTVDHQINKLKMVQLKLLNLTINCGYNFYF